MESGSGLRGYPRPQMERSGWISLDGSWDFSIDAEAEVRLPEMVDWNATIVVPFSPETSASGVGETGFFCAVWYRRSFEQKRLEGGRRLLLHFGAVDFEATVWVNGVEVCSHQGGYTPFTADITEVLREDGIQEVIVRAEDDPADLAKPRGKQDWKLHPHSIWYPRTTGIWQTVWMEEVPPAYVDSVRWTSNLERWEIGFEAYVHGKLTPGCCLAVRMKAGTQMLAQDSYSLVSGEVHRRIALSDPGIDDYRNTLLWSPATPTIIDVEIELRDESGAVLDKVTSYTALRSIATQGDRFVLNGRPLVLRLVLDQGYWKETGLTAPDDDALFRDVLLAKNMGFNGVRKHQKIEDPRFLYWADHLGLLVWEEMPSAYRYTQRSVERLTAEWIEVMKRDNSHPCIVAWVPFNESWGVPDLPDSSAQRNYVQALYHLTKTLDPTRPVIGNDGWESVATDIIGIHDYDDQPQRIARRYGSDDIEAKLLKSERPGGRMLLLGTQAPTRQPIVLTEFGGIARTDNAGDWGYSSAETAGEFLQRYTALLETVRSLPALAGFCYTQFTDTYQEANGLLFADRTPKAPFEDLWTATTGTRRDQDSSMELMWRERIMELQRRNAPLAKTGVAV
ncbi:MAG: glycoside hydrolase family 2 TIM barrel-domain containing protein [Acidobacteriaceae bacterium]